MNSFFLPLLILFFFFVSCTTGVYVKTLTRPVITESKRSPIYIYFDSTKINDLEYLTHIERVRKRMKATGYKLVNKPDESECVLYLDYGKTDSNIQTGLAPLTSYGSATVSATNATNQVNVNSSQTQWVSYSREMGNNPYLLIELYKTDSLVESSEPILLWKGFIFDSKKYDYDFMAHAITYYMFKSTNGLIPVNLNNVPPQH